VAASTDGGVTWTSLCGEYTHNGSIYQDPGNPVYDGTQRDWVLESMNLSDYLGQRIKLQFSLISDAASNGDGFYLDDARVRAKLFDSTSIGIATLENNAPENIIASPNPASTIAELQMYCRNSFPATMSIRNVTGQVLLTEYLSLENGVNKKDIDVSAWPEGMYIAQINGESYHQQIKLIVHHH
jgi:hypothetical protein